MLAPDSGEILYHFIYSCVVPRPPPALCSHLIISVFLCFLWPLFSTLSVSHGPLSSLLLGNSSLRDWSEPNREQGRRCQLLGVCSAAGRQAFAKLWAHKHTRRVDSDTFTWDHRNIREKKWEKQLYLFSADPATAKGSLLASQWNIFFSTNSVDRWGCLFVTSRWRFFSFVLFIYLYNQGNKNVFYIRGKGDGLCGLTGN